MPPPFTLRQQFELYMLEDGARTADEREEAYFEAMGKAAKFALAEHLTIEDLRHSPFPKVLEALAAVTDPDRYEPFHPTSRMKEYAALSD